MELNDSQYSLLFSLLPIFSAIIGLFAAIIGGYIAHIFSAKRDRENKKREQRTNYLLEAFILISKSVNGRISDDSNNEIQKAIDLIQVFGNSSEIKLAQEFSEQLASSRNADIYPLLHQIRDDLREQLEMPKVKNKMIWLVISEEPKLISFEKNKS